MAKFAPVAPIHILEELHNVGIDDYHLLLAHDIVKQPKEYAYLFRHSRGHNKDYDSGRSCVILDNSVVELGNAVSLEIIREAAEHVNPNVVVLPDAYLDGLTTIALLKEWEPRFERAFGQRAEFMVVPQGQNYPEWLGCAQEMRKIAGPRVRWWGCPRNLVDSLKLQEDGIVRGRIGAARILHTMRPDWKIHLLGFSDVIPNDINASKVPRVFGIDSAVPLRAGSMMVQFNTAMKLPKRGTWWDTAIYHPQMAENVKAVQALIDA